MAANETLETLRSRHTIRRYLDKPVDEEMLHTIIDAGLHCGLCFETCPHGAIEKG